ncbi:uncharacterized protein LOC23687674 [Aedes aegypti]|uniref:Uncharacterized protein n=1 Tax=Aedes aegypti TaxID=7159 RepID=A0A6I8U3Y5_AEDAE|nr:uncharacterized protein LOC23687674 [Aedes aegypti]
MNPVSLYITTSRLVFQSGCGSGAGPGGGTDAGGGGPNNVTGGNSSSSAFADLNRLLPYLRKSLSCAVCCRLLMEPHTPAELNCQHHVCRGCVGERKKLKPSCAACKDYNRYVENTQLRMLLQCYKSICEYIKTKPFFGEIRKQATGNASVNGISVVTMMGSGGAASGNSQPISVPSNLFELIEEGAQFQDNYRCSSGLTKSAYSILPCIYPAPPVTVTGPPSAAPSSAGSQLPSQQVTAPSSGIGAQVQAKVHQTTTTIGVPTGPITIVEKQQHHHQQQQQHPHHPNPNRQQIHQQQPQHQQHKEIKFRSAPIKTVSNGSTMYSVLYAGNGNKITIKRKMDPPHIQRKATIHTLDKEGQIKLAKTLADNSAAMSGFKMPQTTGLATSGGGGTMGGQGNVTVVNATNAGAMSKQTAKQLLKRRGCRCGNATATPGKLTCCGQRCPCYVDSKSCVDCKCRGCRNPHRADGMKVRPHIPELQNLEINLHNPNEEEVLTTATTTVLAPQQTVSSMGTNSGTHINVLGQTSLASTSVGQQPNAGLTAVSTGAKGLTQISHLPGGSTLKITPTSIANVLNSTNHQLIGGPDGMEMVPSGGLLDSNGFSYITQASLDTGTGVGVAPTGPTTTQYNVSNGGTIHVVGIYATHLGDVSNMIRTDTGLNSLLTHKPPDALLTQSSLNPLTMSTPSSLLGHALFNPSTTATMSTSGGVSNIMSSSAVGGVHNSAHSGLELAGIGVGDGTGIDIGDQLDLTGTNLITIDGTLDDRLHADDV